MLRLLTESDSAEEPSKLSGGWHFKPVKEQSGMAERLSGGNGRRPGGHRVTGWCLVNLPIHYNLRELQSLSLSVAGLRTFRREPAAGRLCRTRLPVRIRVRHYRPGLLTPRPGRGSAISAAATAKKTALRHIMPQSGRVTCRYSGVRIRSPDP